MKKKLLSVLMTLAMVVTMIPAFGVTVSATYNVGDIPGTTGKGTKSDPVIVDTFAELKAAMQSNEDLYIKVDRFQYPTGMKCYPLQNPEDYGTGDVAIRQVGKKHLEINTIVSLICLDNGNLYATIGVFGELTISGTGRIEGGFNADQSNSVFYVASPGKLNCNGLDVCVKNVQDTYGYAIDNYTGTVTVYSGLFQGWNAPAIINSNDSKLSIIGGAFEVTNKLGDKYALITGKQNVNISGGLFVTGLRCDDGQLNDLLVEGYSYYKNDYYTNANTLYNVSNNSSSSERLKVLSDQGDQKVISTVNISISAPKVGEKPQSAVLKTDNVLVTSTEWLCDGKTITSADKFEAGKSYAVQVKLKTENGYSFTDKPNVIFNDSTDGTVYASGTNYLYSQLKFSPISDSIEPTHVVNATALNVRESPDSGSARIGGVTKGKEVTVVETKG